MCTDLLVHKIPDVLHILNPHKSIRNTSRFPQPRSQGGSNTAGTQENRAALVFLVTLESKTNRPVRKGRRMEEALRPSPAQAPVVPTAANPASSLKFDRKDCVM